MPRESIGEQTLFYKLVSEIVVGRESWDHFDQYCIFSGDSWESLKARPNQSLSTLV